LLLLLLLLFDDWKEVVGVVVVCWAIGDRGPLVEVLRGLLRPARASNKGFSKGGGGGVGEGERKSAVRSRSAL